MTVAFMPEPVNAWDSPPPPEHYYWDQLDDRLQYEAGVMWTWTVYQGTIDAPPGWFIVRPFLIERGASEPVPFTGYMADTLERAREPLEMMGLALTMASDDDPPGVLETWV
jgi:hypothetical protein